MEDPLAFCQPNKEKSGRNVTLRHTVDMAHGVLYICRSVNHVGVRLCDWPRPCTSPAQSRRGLRREGRGCRRERPSRDSMRGRWRTGTSRAVWRRRSGARSRYFKEEEYAFSWSSGPARGDAAGFGSLRPGAERFDRRRRQGRSGRRAARGHRRGPQPVGCRRQHVGDGRVRDVPLPGAASRRVRSVGIAPGLQHGEVLRGARTRSNPHP